MDWCQLYAKAVSNFRSRLPLSQGLAVAFNTNIDGIINLDSERLSEFLSSHRDISDQAFTRRNSPPGRIVDPVDFVAGLMHFVERGAGGEYMIHNEDTYEWIVSNLPIDKHRMGGNAGIMTNALSRLGAKFVIPHAVQLPERQAKLFLDRENILLPVIRRGRVSFAPPSSASRQERELVHLILEFGEGISFQWGGETVTSPRNNRYIVNADDYNGRIMIDPAFVEGVNRKLGEIDKFILTGLHMLKRHYPDGVTYKDRLKESLDLIRRWKKLHSSLKIHFELADIQDAVIREDVVETACQVADSVGMNEDELQTILGVDHLGSPSEMAEGMFDFITSRGVGKLLLHSKDFVASLVTDGYGIAPKTIRDSNMLGVLSSQNRAYSGEFGGPDDLEALVSSGALEVSPIGLQMYKGFRDVLGRDVSPGVWRRRFDGEEAWVVLTPCMLSKVTLNTVGLGDCLTAGSVLSEITS